MSVARISADIGTLLRTSEVRAALAYLNARTRFRFTGVYHVDPPTLRNIHLFDRENPDLNVSGSVTPLDIGYCGIACATNATFTTADAQSDARLQSHPARDSMISYAGVPIRMPGGAAWGTVCHFDGRPRFIQLSELALLEAVVPLFADWVQEHCQVS